MELLPLRYFRVVARLEHMTKAAEELGITQPSLSTTIRRLESEVGVPLFNRQGRSIRLNQFGKTFLEHVEAVFRELDAGRRKVRDMAGLEQGEISVAAASLNWLPGLLQRFQALHPAVRFQLSRCPLAEMPHGLATGAYDFCFQLISPNQPGIQSAPLLTHEILLVVSPKHRFASQKSIPLRAVANEAVVIEKAGDGLRDLVDHCCQQVGFTPRITYEIDEPAALFEFVKANLGVAFAPSAVKGQIAEHHLTALQLTDPICQCTFALAWSQAHYLSEAARTFREFVVGSFANRGEATLAL